MIQDNLRRIQDQIAAAAQAAGRPPPRLVTVTKNRTPDQIRAAVAAGAADLGENRPQELEQHREALGVTEGVRWHFIGRLQSNKIGKVLQAASLLHSVDSLKLLDRLEARAARDQVPEVPLLLQVNVSGEASKAGFSPDELEAAALRALELPRLAPRGLMTMAPADADEVGAGACFRGLRRALEGLQARLGEAWTGHELSMGMSQDFRVAIAEGSTLVRIGSAIFQEGN